MPRHALNSAGYDVPIEGFSQMITAPAQGQFVFLSGLTARTTDGTIVGPGDIAAQTRQVMESMKAILAEADASLDDVLQIHTYVRDITQWPQIEAVWREYWGHTWPASTMVEVQRLFDERQLIETDAIARVEG